MKADDKVNVTVQLAPDLLGKVDERAELLDLNRSQYLRRLVKRDLGIPQPELEADEPKQLELHPSKSGAMAA